VADNRAGETNMRPNFEEIQAHYDLSSRPAVAAAISASTTAAADASTFSGRVGFGRITRSPQKFPANGRDGRNRSKRRREWEDGCHGR
jgi:hypothetical protein